MCTLPLTETELETPRKPEELRAWCGDKIEQVASVKDGTNAIRMGRGLCKPLVEEVYLLGIWACGADCVSERALITPRMGSQPFDAQIFDPEHDPDEYYGEVTQAHMGQVEHFRMLHLEKEGWAPGPLSGVTREGKRGAALKPGRVTSSLTGHISKTRELIREAVVAKLKKDYPQPIVLLVAFEDFIVKNDPDIAEILRTDIVNLTNEEQSPFFRIFLVGTSERLLIRVDIES